MSKESCLEQAKRIRETATEKGCWYPETWDEGIVALSMNSQHDEDGEFFKACRKGEPLALQIEETILIAHVKYDMS